MGYNEATDITIKTGWWSELELHNEKDLATSCDSLILTKYLNLSEP